MSRAIQGIIDDRRSLRSFGPLARGAEMSVAFRRESDEEHKEPRFELPIPPGPNLVTPRGLALIRAKVAELEAGVAAEQDKDVLEARRRDLRYWHTRETTAQLAPEPGTDEVAIGS